MSLIEIEIANLPREELKRSASSPIPFDTLYSVMNHEVELYLCRRQTWKYLISFDTGHRRCFWVPGRHSICRILFESAVFFDSLLQLRVSQAGGVHLKCLQTLGKLRSASLLALQLFGRSQEGDEQWSTQETSGHSPVESCECCGWISIIEVPSFTPSIANFSLPYQQWTTRC